MTEATALTRPEDAGIAPGRLEALLARVRRDVDDGTLDSAQVAVARHGRLVCFETFGAAVQGGERRPATNETLYAVFSSTKAVVGAATWALIEEGLLSIEERVADIIPEWATNGKDAITVEQVMLHIGGFPRAPMGPPDWETREGRLRALSRWSLNWEPGSQFEYHATSAHWVLAEIIERRTGQDFRAYVHERILGPAGVEDFWLGLPPELDGRVAEVGYRGEPVPPPGGWGEVTPQAILRFNDPGTRRVGVPGGGGIGTAAALALFYQPLIHGGRAADGRIVLKPGTIDYATRVRTLEYHRDPVLGHPVNRALTVVVAGEDGNSHLRGFGRTVSPRAFGHGGAGGQIGWGDPETGISLGYCTNTFVDEIAAGRRITAVSSLAASLAAAEV